MSCPDGLLTVVILAGGKGSRLGSRDKGFLAWRDRPFIEHLLQNIEPFTRQILINANQNIAAYQRYGYPVVADDTPEYAGPLAGMLAALRVVRTPYILTMPCDAPLTSPAIIERFCEAYAENPVKLYVASTADGLQPVYAMISRALLSSLQQYLASGNRKVRAWMKINEAVVVDFDKLASEFVNINTETDWQKLC